MNYTEKGLKWRDRFLKKRDTEIEYISVENGVWTYWDKDARQIPEIIYFCMRKDGMRVAETFWKKNNTEKQVLRFVIKNRRKLIFVQNQNEETTAYGFGFGSDENKENCSIVLYIRIGRGARLLWADSTSAGINDMYEVRDENPEKLDCLVEFMKGDGAMKA